MDDTMKNTPSDPLVMLQQNLAEKFHPLIERTQTLLDAVGRTPDEIAEDDEDTAGKFTDMIRLLTACHKAAETGRVGEKEPYRRSAEAVDGWFKGQITNRLEAAKASVQKRLNAYQQRKIDKARRLAREEQEKQAAAAALLAQKAEATGDDHALDAAARAETESVAAKAVAEAKPSELGQVRGDYGGMATVQMRWKGYVDSREQLDLEKLRPYFNADDLAKALNAAVRAGLRDCRGARIVQEANTMVR